jgi:hypothetical protein
LAPAGCAGDGPASTTGGDSFSRMQTEVFNVNCLGAGCHNPQSQAGGLVLSEGFSYDALVNVDPTNPAALAEGLLRVVPFDTANSFLVIKLTEPGAAQGDRMPQGQPPLSPDDLSLVTEWILSGAPPPQTPTGPAEATATPVATASATPTDTPPLPTATPTTPTATSPTATTSPDVTATASPSPTQAVTLADVQSQVFTPNCLTPFCHTASAQAGGLVLENGASAAALVNVPAVNFDAMNNGLLRVAPGNPEASFLYIKLTAPTLPQGSRMPMGQPPLADNLIALVRAWIEQGAL